jgi:Zn-dependent protease
MRREWIAFRMHSSGWLLLALCILFGIGVCGPKHGTEAGILLVISLLLHESGHMLMARTLRVPVHEFGLCWAGAYNRRANAHRRRHDVLISVAGPLMNLALVIPALFIPNIGSHVAVWNLALCILNLTPLPSTDGLRILRALYRPVRVKPVVPRFRTNEPALLVRLR